MATPHHIALVERIEDLNRRPVKEADYPEWLMAGELINLMQWNETASELIVFASVDSIFVNAVLVEETELESLTVEELVDWNASVSQARVGIFRHGRHGVLSLDVGLEVRGWPMKRITPLVFLRESGRSDDSSERHYEVLQEYPHALGAHWLPERGTFSIPESHYDWNDIVTITKGVRRGDVSLVSFKREELDRYLAASNCVVARMYEFLLLREPGRQDWDAGKHAVVVLDDNHAYRSTKIENSATWIKGVQIIRGRVI